MPKSSRNKNKCNCGDCKKCHLRNKLRKKLIIKKTTDELRMEMANGTDKHGVHLNVQLKFNNQTNRVEINKWVATSSCVGTETTSNMVENLGKVDGGFYNISDGPK